MRVEMCDQSTRHWCCRIGLILSISSVLLTMMFQIWSYYFSLVREMDKITDSTPTLSTVLSVCNGNVETSWNGQWNKTESYWINRQDYPKNIFVDNNCIGDWRQIPLNACCRVMIWILPW